MTEREWFDSTYRQYFEYIRQLAVEIGITHHIRGVEAWAEDMAQDTFSALLKNTLKDGIPQPWSIRRLLLKYLTNVIGDYFQKLANQEPVFSELWDGDPGIPAPEAANKLSFPDGLAYSDREILYLFYYCGSSTAEIAAYYGISGENCRQRLHRARMRYKELHKKENFSANFSGNPDMHGIIIGVGGANHV